MTIRTAAKALAAVITTAKRDNGETYHLLTEGAPGWAINAAQAAHQDGQMFPNDWRWRVFSDAVDHIADQDEDTIDDDDLAELSGSFADDGVDLYTSELIKWLGSHPDRPAYCDDAVGDYGMPPASEFSIVKLMQMGQYSEREEVFHAVLAYLRENADEIAPDPVEPDEDEAEESASPPSSEG